MTKINQYKRYIFFVLMLIFSAPLNAQKSCSLLITPVDESTSFINELKLKTEFQSKQNCIQYLQQMPALLASKGFISASVDSIKEDSSSIRIKLFIGKKYVWNNLFVDENIWPILNQFGYKKESFNNKPFDANKVNILYEQLLDYFSNTGHPFAKINLDSIVLNDGFISAKLQVDKGSIYYIDSIHVYGSLKITEDFLHRYLEIAPHELYNEKKLSTINERLAELPYIEQTQAWSVSMLNSGAILNLYLQPKRSNEIYALIGFAPANEQLGGKLLLTGEINLNLKNAFATGETIALNWQQLQPRSPRLNVIFQRPYLFHSPFGIDFNFELYKLDSFYLNINAQVGLQYILSEKQSGEIILQRNSTTLLSVDTSLVILTKRLPDVADVSSTSLGLQYNFNNTDYRFNPRSGNEFEIFGSAGNKNISKNNAVLQIKDTSFNYAQLYDSVKLKSYQFRVHVAAAHYFPSGKQSTFKTAINAGIFQSPSYFNNELFQIGGYKLLRGFDEESVFTNRFAVGSLEYHYLLAQNSYFFGFTDFGWAHYESTSLSFSHTYLGVGFGLAFETKTGIFNISYAVGKRNDLSFNLQQSKIHLGFVSVF
ncbi:MAG: POTRA domain-containing protein [Chitinophagaceae bacterium]